MAGAPAPKAGKNALTFVLITVMINAIGFGIIIPVLPSLIVELTGQPLSEAAIHGGWMTFVFAVMQFFCMPIVGALSDAYGRRPIMLLSLSGLAPTIFFLYVGRVIAGALGATFSTANAYIADVTPPEKRAQNFGLVGAAFGLGFILGPAIGGILGDPEGWLGEWANPRLPFLAAGVLAVINTIYGVIFLPETHKPENRIIIPKIGQFWAAIWGIFSAALGYYIIGVSTAGWMIYAAGPFAAFAGLYGPSITNMMSSRVSEKDQGELQGAIGAAQGLAMMIGPLMMTRVFNIFAQEDAQVYQPGAPFILAAILVGLSLLAFIGVTNKSDRDQRHNAASAALASEASE
jgi:MFS family permease